MKRTMIMMVSLMLLAAVIRAEDKQGTVTVSGDAVVMNGTPNVTTVRTGNGSVTVVTATGSAVADVNPGEKTAYLGVTTAPVAEALCAQLKLPVGVGLVVEFVDEDSPAAKVLAKNDVLHKLGDQILVNHEQLQALLHTHKPGDLINLTIIRGGESRKCEVRLSERIGEVSAGSVALSPNMAGVPDEIAKAIQIVISGVGSNMVKVMPHISVMVSSNISAIAGARDLVNSLTSGCAVTSNTATHVSSSQVYVKTNERGTFTLNCTNGKKHFTAVAKDGASLFDGPVNTPDERATLSDALKKELEEIEKTNKPAKKK